MKIQKIKYILILVITAFKLNMNAQAPPVEWQKPIGSSAWDYGKGIVETNDGNYVIGGVAGIVDDGDINCDGADRGYWLSKIDALGNIIWQKCYGGSSSDILNKFIQTDDDGFLMIGTSQSDDGDVGSHYGMVGITDDFWIVKTDASGNIEWSAVLGGTSFDRPNDVTQLSDGSYIIVGETNSNNFDVTGKHSACCADTWVVKLDPLGDLVWQKCLGGTAYDYGRALNVFDDGTMIIATENGSNDGDVSDFLGGIDYWITKLDNFGNIIWAKSFGGSGLDYPTAMVTNNIGEIIIGGYTASVDGDISFNHGATDVWIIKINTDGELIWERSYGGSEVESINSIDIDEDNNIFYTGFTSSNNGDVEGLHTTPGPDYDDIWTFKTDNDANLSWQKCLGGSLSDYAYSGIFTSDNGFIISGSTESVDGDVIGNHGFFDHWLIKLECNEGVYYYVDNDLDGFGSEDDSILACDPPFAYVSNKEDCNDGYFFANPDATEICNGIDDNCDANIDEGVLGLYFVDSDMDGYGNPDITLLACTPPPNYILDNTDCNDSDFFVNPGAAEICNGIDENCNALSDDGLAIYNYFADFDADGFGNPGFIISTCSEIPDGYTLDNTDCNDSDDNIFPGAIEVCNGTDDNCDFVIDDGLPEYTFYADLDGDEYGNSADFFVSCNDTGLPGYVNNSTDCNDADININPSAMEMCNLIDDDCDGAIDEDLLMHIYFADADNDDYGDPDADDIFCDVVPPDGYVYDNTDCDDTNPNIYPGSTEIANGLDDDCDQLIDEGIVAISDEDISDNFIISPNPNSGSFIINYSFHANISGNNYSITILNTSGEKVYSKNFQNTNTKAIESINVDFLIAGVYLLEWNDGNKIYTKKIVITD